MQQRLVKTGRRLMKHAKDYWLFLAQGHLTKRLVGNMVRPVQALPLPTGQEVAAGKQTRRREEQARSGV